MKRWIILAAALFSATWVAAVAQTQAKSLDFATFRAQVEPIFLKKRPDHARCAACHTASASNFQLQPLAPGATNWTEAESRLNFENVSHLVVPGNPDKSRLAIHPLAPEAGGDDFHGGGHQFESKDDPDWQTIAAWIAAAR
jgi:hypothetical protein